MLDRLHPWKNERTLLKNTVNTISHLTIGINSLILAQKVIASTA